MGKPTASDLAAAVREKGELVRVELAALVDRLDGLSVERQARVLLDLAAVAEKLRKLGK